ncbi:hypothetical protein HPB51_011224 [Rhipicephalus microplus]|uniref:Uncharacterized protein n=1 Tax=Rhipicephalus microplus TaxID=6941 RepID=A0A9J6F346_RHIMP|nr:hypothetical protein HPB51_011224 [Rhipicephalus microplus]
MSILSILLEKSMSASVHNADTLVRANDRCSTGTTLATRPRSKDDVAPSDGPPLPSSSSTEDRPSDALVARATMQHAIEILQTATRASHIARLMLNYRMSHKIHIVYTMNTLLKGLKELGRLMFSTQRGHVVINEDIPFKVVQTTDRGCLFGRDLHKVQNSRNRQPPQHRTVAETQYQTQPDSLAVVNVYGPSVSSVSPVGNSGRSARDEEGGAGSLWSPTSGSHDDLVGQAESGPCVARSCC